MEWLEKLIDIIDVYCIALVYQAAFESRFPLQKSINPGG